MQKQEKKIAGEAAAALVEAGMVLGLGTGSTVTFFLEALSKKIQQGMKVRGVPTSDWTATLCRPLGIELLDIHSVDRLDLTVDGADEIDHKFRMIKGGGGALLREKIIAEISERVVIIVDSTKLVDLLGIFPLPVEVIRFGYKHVQSRLADMGIVATLRFSGGKPYITDNGHYILDCPTGLIHEPELLSSQLKAVTGVVDSGLFTNHCHTLILGKEDTVILRSKDS
ncbi:Ribose 5-phosphate isomerase A [invertebrate metagenome]|uniref:ribose-5-phosphate isomerase n=1 Tax=invertebrate metagenome TaxID=1711999 RepID=A0A484HD43_9ZZZZ